MRALATRFKDTKHLMTSFNVIAISLERQEGFAVSALDRSSMNQAAQIFSARKATAVRWA